MKDLEAVLAPINQAMIANNSAAGKTPPPIDQWALQAQAHCGEINIYIDARGKWFHEGDPINRQSLVKLFASIFLGTVKDPLKTTSVSISILGGCTPVESNSINNFAAKDINHASHVRPSNTNGKRVLRKISVAMDDLPRSMNRIQHKD